MQEMQITECANPTSFLFELYNFHNASPLTKLKFDQRAFS